MSLLDFGTLPKVTALELIGLNVDPSEIDDWIAQYHIAAAARSKGLECSEVEPSINGHEWMFTGTVLVGWYLLQRTDISIPEAGFRPGEYLLVANREEHGIMNMAGQAIRLTTASDLPLKNDRVIATPSHITAMQRFIVVTMMDHILRDM